MDAIQKQKLTSLVKETIVGMEQRQAATSFLRDVMDQAKQDGFKPKQINAIRGESSAKESVATSDKEEQHNSLYDEDIPF